MAVGLGGLCVGGNVEAKEDDSCEELSVGGHLVGAGSITCWCWSLTTSLVSLCYEGAYNTYMFSHIRVYSGVLSWSLDSIQNIYINS